MKRQCIICRHTWISRVSNPRLCPKCQRPLTISYYKERVGCVADWDGFSRKTCPFNYGLMADHLRRGVIDKHHPVHELYQEIYLARKEIRDAASLLAFEEEKLLRREELRKRQEEWRLSQQEKLRSLLEGRDGRVL